MQFVDNGNLEDLLEAGNLSLPLIIRFAIDIAKGLNWLHHKGIIHRDLKPANILIDRNYSIKLADFGLSHVKSRKGSDVGFYGVCGTSCYMAPEVISKKPYGIKCDVFSFGLLLCELIMGEYPYDQKKVPSKSEAFEKKIVEGLRPSIPEDCPAALAQLLTQCWQADPEQRPSMDRVLVLLKKFDTELKAKNDDILDQLPETAVKLIDQEKAKVQALQQEMCRGKARLRSLQADLKNTKSALAKEKRARRALEGELSQIQAGVSGEQAECIKLREELDLERLRFAKERKEFDVLRNRSDLHVAKYSQATQLHNTRASARAVGKKLANVPQKGKAQIVEDRENAHPNFVAPQPRLKRICSNLSGDQISNGNKKLEAPGAVSESTPISFRTRWRGARKDCEFGEEKKSDSEENSEEIEEATSSGNEENSEGENKEEDESEECEESDNNIAESESVEKNWTCLFSPIRTRYFSVVRFVYVDFAVFFCFCL